MNRKAKEAVVSEKTWCNTTSLVLEFSKLPYGSVILRLMAKSDGRLSGSSDISRYMLSHG